VTVTRAWGLAVSLAMLAAVAWPLGRDPLRGDSFPLSTYPMFATPRPDARLRMAYVIATGPDGRRRHVPPALVASPEVMQTIITVQRAVARGEAPALCRRVAAGLVGRARYRGLTEVQVIAGDHRAIAYLVRGERGSERVVARCPLEAR
jgi:hypothetical protein